MQFARVRLFVPHGLFVHGILQARILAWVVFPFYSRSSQPRDQTQVPHCRQVLCQLSHKGSPNNAEVDVFLELSCFIYDPMDVGNLLSGFSSFSKSSLNIWKFTVHILLKPGLENFEHYFASMWDECSCAVAWTFFGIALLWNGNPLQNSCLENPMDIGAW